MTASLARGLAALLCLQLLVPIQAHSRIAHDARGLTIVVCTLDGTRNVQLDPGDTASAAIPHTSAAMLFSDLLHNVSPLIAALQPPRLMLAWTTVNPTQTVPFHHREPCTPRSRDPPRAV